jgi:hypothetical protein
MTADDLFRQLAERLGPDASDEEMAQAIVDLPEKRAMLAAMVSNAGSIPPYVT